MKPVVAIAIYKPKPGFRAELLDCLSTHAGTLRAEELLSHRPETLLEDASGAILEIIEWRTEESAASAHKNPRVLAIWGRLESVATFQRLSDLDPTTLATPFAKFQPVLSVSALGRDAIYADNMLGTKNESEYARLVDFYHSRFGLDFEFKSDGYTTLIDPVSRQRLCITNGESVSRMSAGYSVNDIEKALSCFEKAGGTILKHWEYKTIKGATCHDPLGNEIMIWQAIGS